MVARGLNQERRRAVFGMVCVASLAWAPTFVPAQERSITMASTTSTEQSGLFAHLLPAFKQATDIDVKVVAVGTGQAIDMARRGDADVLFVHDKAAEEKFVAEGFGRQALSGHVQRLRPRRPEGRSRRREGQRHRRGARRRSPRPMRPSSRAATRAAPMRPSCATGRQTGIDGAGDEGPRLQGVRLRHGAGAQHRVASERLRADRPRHLAQLQEPGDLAVLVEGDKRLFNQYGVMVVSPAKYPHVEGAARRRNSSTG